MRIVALITFIMRIERKRNLKKLINSRQNGQIKIITGVRRCGKSYLLGVLYRDYLMQEQIFIHRLYGDIRATDKRSLLHLAVNVINLHF